MGRNKSGAVFHHINNCEFYNHIHDLLQTDNESSKRMQRAYYWNSLLFKKALLIKMHTTEVNVGFSAQRELSCFLITRLIFTCSMVLTAIGRVMPMFLVTEIKLFTSFPLIALFLKIRFHNIAH